MKKLLSSTAMASIFVLGAAGLGYAQGEFAVQPGMTQGRATGQTSGTIGDVGTAGLQASTEGQTGSTGQPGTQAGAAGQVHTGNQAQRMSEEQVRTALQGRGYSDIQGLQRDGDNFKVSQAKRSGAEVKDLRIGASTDEVGDEARLSKDQARQMLRDRGYSDVSRDGGTIRAKAKQNDLGVNLRIDARTGAVTQQAS